jgi:2-polyprenyl-3-methyl-5-hydroxy-6-metoxy-1,4-benzoquinol methylase
MNFVHKKYLIGNSKEVIALQKASERLYQKLNTLNINELDVSEYSQVYFSKHQTSLKYLLQMYTLILFHFQRKVKKPFDKIIVVDHGAGIGILSLLCKELGMNVIYNDIYNQVVKDAEIISKTVELPLDYYHHGSIEDLANYCKKQNIFIDGIVSSEVIEHIYDIELFFKNLDLLPSKKLHFVFSTSANNKNLLRRRKLMQQQYISEHIGEQEFFGRKEKDSLRSFLKIREEIIKENTAKMSLIEIQKLAIHTRGMRKSDIIAAIKEFESSNIFPEVLNHKTNTCDPNTGNWVEHLMEPKALQKSLALKNRPSEIKSGFYSIGNENFASTFVKNTLNIMIKILGKKSIYISHYWMLVSK